MCELKEDRKTFDYIQILKNYIDDKQKIFDLEMEIQLKEILMHLAVNHITENINVESCKWISKCAKEFRDYLNTIESFIKEYQNINTYDEYCEKIKTFNKKNKKRR